MHVIDHDGFRKMLAWWKANNFASIAFSGTSKGMTPTQLVSLRDIIAVAVNEVPLVHFHHGDWVGAVTEAHELAMACPHRTLKVIVHPPEAEDIGCGSCRGHFTRPRRPAYIRNDDIVDDSHLLLIAPWSKQQQPVIQNYRDPVTGQVRQVSQPYVDHWDAFLKARKARHGIIILPAEPYSLRVN